VTLNFVFAAFFQFLPEHYRMPSREELIVPVAAEEECSD